MNTDTSEQDYTDEDEDLDTQDTESNESEQEQDALSRNALALSDEEVMAMDSPDDFPDQSSTDSTSAARTAQDTDDDDDDNAEESEEFQDTDDATESESETEFESADDESADAADEKAGSQTKKAESRDIAAEHARLFAPIKVRGKEVEIRSVDEALSLMQKGADYHRKTEELAPHRKTIATLEKAGIKPADLNHLIALHNKDPQAITKLLADAQLDPLDLDTESDETKNYKPQDYTVSDSDLALDETLDRLKTTPTYNQLINVVGNEWDDASREVIANNPELLAVINDHIAGGFYPLIERELTRQRALGQLQGLSDLAAYQSVGEAINAEGGFNHLITDEQRAQAARRDQSTQARKVSRPRMNSSDRNLNAKRRAASPTKAASASKGSPLKQNPMGQSDEEFMKQIGASL